MTEDPAHRDDEPIAPGLTGPLVICTIELPTHGTLGLTHCPGRNHIDGAGRHWRRSLDQDLGSIARWGADGIVSLVETHELANLGVPALGEKLAASAVRWFHLPIEDMHAPGAAFAQAWQAQGTELLGMLRDGKHLIVHCAAGLGRTGMLAAKLLVASGMAPRDAIALVRERRAGTIETQMQFDYVMNEPQLISQ
jgi:ADP-ribosyl-[dinitrogen reductase] hydrolase